jgi:hypothetical protein
MRNYAEQLISNPSKELRVQIGRRLYKLVPAEKLTFRNMSSLLDEFDVRLLVKGKDLAMANPLTPQEMREISSLRDSFLEEMDFIMDQEPVPPEEFRRHYYLRGKVDAIQAILATYDGKRQKTEEMVRGPRHGELLAEYARISSSPEYQKLIEKGREFRSKEVIGNPVKLSNRQKKRIAFWAAWFEDTGVPRNRAMKMAYAKVLAACNPLAYHDYKQALQGEGWAIGDYTDMISKADTPKERRKLTHIMKEEQEHVDELIDLMMSKGLHGRVKK